MKPFPASFLLLALPFTRLIAETPAEWAGNYLREAAKEDLPGVAVLVGREGKILFQGGFGSADLEKKTPINVETKFRIGSVTKQFTAAAILKLAEDGKLSLTDPLAKFFPAFPKGETITLHHLLTHTSGLHNYTDQPNFYGSVTQPISPAALIASFQDDPPDFAPGTNFRYCNSGYFLLGEIVAKASGQSYADYLRTTFFEPLGMKDTGVYVNASPPPGIARGYAVENGKTTPALDWDMSRAGGAGAIYSTVGDLLRWTEALHGGRVVNAASLKAMTTPHPLPAGADGMNYGYGLVMSEKDHLPTIGHNGGLHGWSSNVMWFPQQKATFIALANAMPTVRTLTPGIITDELPRHFLADDIARAPAPLEDKTVDPKSYAAFTGRYDYQDSVMTVTVENNHLFARLTGQAKYEIFPRSADEFFWKVADARVRFLRDEQGAVVAAEHTQSGNTFRAARIKADPVKVTAAELQACVGQYLYAPGAIATITRDGPQLFAQLTGQSRAPIFPIATDTFEWHITAAKVRFIKDDTGKVIKAVHEQNGATLEAPKIK